MTNIYVFTQNVKIQSFSKLTDIKKKDRNIFVTTHMLFGYEMKYLCSMFGNCEFYKIADFMTDMDNELCDTRAYDENISVEEYYERIKVLKNQIIVKRINDKFCEFKGYLCSDSLGIDAKEWLENGYLRVFLDYYYPENVIDFKGQIKLVLKRVKFLRKINEIKKRKIYQRNITDEIYVAKGNGKKYVFIGNMSRVSYRMDLSWNRSEEEQRRLKRGNFEMANKTQYLSSLHECYKCIIPDKPQYDVRYIQDGYLPPNYSSRYLRYKPQNVKYYAWDELGERIFKYHNMPVNIMPFRKKLYMPNAKFKDRVKTILVATSGPGDWTAQKNRSDDDLLLQAFVEVAQKCPNIVIIYRCHPTWTHPNHAGTNSINRAGEYIDSTGLKNIYISTNIPEENLSSFILSFSRSSLEEDLKDADMVFGEHSVSMLDGAFQGIPFASVNLTGRRNLFCGITEMGFPHCESVGDIIMTLNEYCTVEFQSRYQLAIEKYNEMTNIEN